MCILYIYIYIFVYIYIYNIIYILYINCVFECLSFKMLMYCIQYWARSILQSELGAAWCVCVSFIRTTMKVQLDTKNSNTNNYKKKKGLTD